MVVGHGEQRNAALMLQALALWPQPSIAHLSSDNGIGVEGAKELANGLMKNSTLTSLNLRGMPSFPAACMTAPCPSDFVMHFYKSLWPWRWHGVLLEYGVWCQCMFFVSLFFICFHSSRMRSEKPTLCFPLYIYPNVFVCWYFVNPHK